MTEFSPISLQVDSIDDPDAIDDIAITFESLDEQRIVTLTEEQAAYLEGQIHNTLQDRADKRTERALEAVYNKAEQRRIATWNRIKTRKQESRA